MMQNFKSDWLTLSKDDRRIGQAYVYLGPLSGSMHLEGWVKFPPGTKEIQIIVNTDNLKNDVDEKETDNK
ncbi:MAG: hypothetical protein E4H06_02240 [Methanosarcina sp.]|nr:MAG: hypothetical protein E4H06_02240 [Methanosarcina sp.]